MMRANESLCDTLASGTMVAASTAPPLCKLPVRQEESRQPRATPRNLPTPPASNTMRPISILAPFTYKLAPSMAVIAGTDTLTVTGEHSATVKGWTPGTRPLTRRNGIAALACALRLSDHPDAAAVLERLLAGGHRETLALALALQGAWANPAAIVDGWNKAGDWTHDGTLDVIAHALAGLAVDALATADAAACADLVALETARTAKGRTAPLPIPTPDKVTLAMAGLPPAAPEVARAEAAALATKPTKSRKTGRRK